MAISLLTLNNSSKLLVVPLGYSQSTTIMALVNAGPRFDPQGKEGLSHFTEHMLFRGTKKFPTRQKLALNIERYGAAAEAFSFHELNKYWVKCSNSETEIAIENLMDRLQNSLLRSRDIEEEKGVVQEERRILKSNPEKYIWDLWSEVCWSGTGLGRVYVGNKASIESFNRSDVIKFVQNYYSGERIVYIVCGDVEPKRVIEVFNKNVSGISSGNLPVVVEALTSSVKKGSKIIISQSDTENITVALGFLTVGFKDSDRPALELLSFILGGGMNSKLRKIMELGLVYSIEAHAEHLSDTGYFMVMFSTGKDSLKKVVSLIINEISILKQKELNKQELLSAKDYAKGSFKVNTETSYDFADWYGNRYFLGEETTDLKERDAQINRITTGDILKVANNYFNDLKIAVIGNISEKEIILAIGDKI